MKAQLLEQAVEALEKEIEGIAGLKSIIDKNFLKIAEILSKCAGHIIISGVGKSGYIGQKISSTLSSLGIASFFLHPGEASHGDLGMLLFEDIIILISNSGETKEFNHLLTFIKERNILSIAITRNEFSTIASRAAYKITLPAFPEIVSYGAPTTSTTQALVTGDILAFLASRYKGFTDKNYAEVHPGGKLGLSLNKVSSIMKFREDITIYSENEKVSSILPHMNNGFCIIENKEGRLIGIITDGDIRRGILKFGNLLELKASEILSKNPITLPEEENLASALEAFNHHKIGTIIIVDKAGKVKGVLERKDIDF